MHGTCCDYESIHRPGELIKWVNYNFNKIASRECWLNISSFPPFYYVTSIIRMHTRSIRLVTQFSLSLSHINESIYLLSYKSPTGEKGLAAREPHYHPPMQSLIFTLCTAIMRCLCSLEPEILPHISLSVPTWVHEIMQNDCLNLFEVENAK